MLLYIYGFFIIRKIHTLSKFLKFDENYEMLGKNQGKILLRYYQQTLSDFSITLYPSQASIPFHTTFLSVSFAVKFPKASSIFWIFLRRKSFSTKTTDFSSSVLKTRGSFIVLNLSTISSYLLSTKNQASAFDENFVTPHQVTLCKKILFLGLLFVFLSFLFFGLLRPLLQICRV